MVKLKLTYLTYLTDGKTKAIQKWKNSGSRPLKTIAIKKFESNVTTIIGTCTPQVINPVGDEHYANMNIN